ncbi:MAG: hypothetical protein ACK56F_27560, partial [bacterium]
RLGRVRPVQHGVEEERPADLQLERHRLLRVGGIELEQRRLGLCETVLTRHRGGLHPFSTSPGGD